MSVTGIPENLRPQLERVSACSPYAAGVLARYPQLLTELVSTGRLARKSHAGEISALVADCAPATASEDDIARSLRTIRHRELLRILWRDIAGGSTVVESLRDLSDLADAAIGAALAWSTESLRARHGLPRTEAGEPCGLGILGMGKLGGYELNFSSDVDLIFVFSEAGETDGPKRLANEEYFRLLGQRLVGLLSRKTPDGFVYRVDVRLRPFGSTGPLAVSLPALENYLMQNGRDWERYAYVKARVINEWPDTEYFYRDVVRPFVYRRYLDYGVFSSLREMKALIEAEVERKEFETDIKLGPGGIREIEFIVQSFQLVRGGSIAELRERQLLKVLPALGRHGCLPAPAVAELTDAYLFLRRVENSLQAINDQQTHAIPADDTDRARLALALGCADWAAVAATLERHRAAVARQFRDVVFRSETGNGQTAGSSLRRVWLEGVPPEAAEGLLREAGFAGPGEPAAVLERLRQLRAAATLQRLDEAGRQRLDALVPAVLEIAARQQRPLLAVEGVARVIEAVGRRSAYFALLNENPVARERLVALCAMSDFLAKQVAAHPLLLDELLDQRLFGEPPTRDEFAAELARRLEGVATEEHEHWLEALRNFQQAALFRIAVADLSGVLPLMKVSDRLTETAELVLQAALEHASRELAARHGQPRCVVSGESRAAELGIAAYGKLGGLELGYSSDLDLVFLHDSAGDSQETDGEKPIENAMFFGRVARRVISIATMLTRRWPALRGRHAPAARRQKGAAGHEPHCIRGLPEGKRLDLGAPGPAPQSWHRRQPAHPRCFRGHPPPRAGPARAPRPVAPGRARHARSHDRRACAGHRGGVRHQAGSRRHHRHRVHRPVSRAARGWKSPHARALVRQHPPARRPCGGRHRPGGYCLLAHRHLPRLPPAAAPARARRAERFHAARGGRAVNRRRARGVESGFRGADAVIIRGNRTFRRSSCPSRPSRPST